MCADDRTDDLNDNFLRMQALLHLLRQSGVEVTLVRA